MMLGLRFYLYLQDHPNMVFLLPIMFIISQLAIIHVFLPGYFRTILNIFVIKYVATKMDKETFEILLEYRETAEINKKEKLTKRLKLVYCNLNKEIDNSTNIKPNLKIIK